MGQTVPRHQVFSFFKKFRYHSTDGPAKEHLWSCSSGYRLGYTSSRYRHNPWGRFRSYQVLQKQFMVMPARPQLMTYHLINTGRTSKMHWWDWEELVTKVLLMIWKRNAWTLISKNTIKSFLNSGWWMKSASKKDWIKLVKAWIN